MCQSLIQYSVIAENCTGCGACKKSCPEEAISGEKKKPHVIDQSKCIKCGICFETCKFNAITKR
ncbi:MAG: 4Fe-4S binding protein [Thermoplasmatales archaeon]|nr:4Fe-4S binding protein [Thermoplasmatales archaeon]